MINGPDLFDAAIAARDRRIARLERDLAEARADADALRAELAAADVRVTSHAGPAHVVGFPRFHRSRLVVNHVEVAGTGRTRFDCVAITAEGETLVLSSISEVHLRRVAKAHERQGFVVEHRGDRRGEVAQSAGGAAG